MNIFLIIKKFIMTVICWLQIKNYDISSTSIEYNLTDTKPKITKHNFWKNEMKYWTPYSKNYWVNITNYYKPKIYEYLIKKMPTNVDDFILKVKYYYNGKIYNFISRNQTYYSWPPKPQKSMSFSLPIQSAFILDENGDTIKDITKKVKKCAGPQNNFHNQKIKARDVSTRVFDTLVIKDIIHNEKKFKYDQFLEF